jgi:CYTH domain-containing protein
MALTVGLWMALTHLRLLTLRTHGQNRTLTHAGYEVSQRKRKRVEQSFGWMKMVGMLKKVKLRGIDKVGWLFTFTGAAYNLCRLRNLMAKA